jgi:urea transporter
MINSPIMLLGAIIAILTSLIISSFFKYDSNSIQNGIYGFNSALLGIAIFHFMTPSIFSLTLLVLGSVLATSIMHFMILSMPKNLVFTTPFVISMWLILMIVEVTGIDTSVTPLSSNSTSSFYSISLGVAQVMFQGYWLSGVIFIVGIAFNSYKIAVWAMIGSTLGVLIAQTFEFSFDLTVMGGYGFNATLAAIALAERYKKKQWLILFGIILSILLTRFFEELIFPTLTAPFILACWLSVALSKVTMRNY